MEDVNVGELIQKLRTERGLGFNAFCTLCRISSRTLSKIESGTSKLPDRKSLLAIIAGLSTKERVSDDDKKKILAPFGYRLQSVIPEKEEIDSIARRWSNTSHKMILPAYLVDISYRFIAWNRYAPKLIGLEYGDLSLNRMRDNTLFDLLIDPWFGPGKVVVEKDKLLFDMMYAMRCDFEPYKNEDWCEKTIKAITGKYQNAKKIWKDVSLIPVSGLKRQSKSPVKFLINGSVAEFQLLTTDYEEDSRFQVIQYVPNNLETLKLVCCWVEDEVKKAS